MTESGHYRIEAGSADSIEVNDLAFHETFVAAPATGYLFAGWERQDRGLCGGSLEPCELYTSWMADDDSLLALLESDESFNLTPLFQPSDQIRLYAEGDRVVFSGRMTEKPEFEAEVSVDVTAHLDFRAGTDLVSGKNVLTAQLTLFDQQGVELASESAQYWQEEGGSFFDVRDKYGNLYQDAGTSQTGLESIPAPLVPLSSVERQFTILSGDGISTPLSIGVRSVEVGEEQAVLLPLGSLPAYPVTIADSITYLSGFDVYRRDERVDTERALWVSKVRGIVKSTTTQRRYSKIGKLQNTTTLELEATGYSF